MDRRTTTESYPTVTRKRPATYEDYLALPEIQRGELIDGELIAMSRPRGRHLKLSSVLGALLMGPFQLGRGGPGGWWIVDEPELHLGADIVSPDLAGWRVQDMPEFPDAAFLTQPPHWVCEVLSPTTESDDRIRKMHLYRRERVPYVWLADPLERTIEVFFLDGNRWVLIDVYGGDEITRIVPFDACEMDLAPLWIRPPAASGPATTNSQ